MVIKVIRVGLTPDKVSRVATALAALRAHWPAHPGLVPLLDTGVVDIEPYVVTPWVDGDSLDVALREYGPAHLSDALPRLRRLAEALDTAAAAGVAHGSLHLRDVIVSVEHTVVTGLGVAQVLERVGVRPPVRRPYCAPEVADGGSITPAADQHALAAIAGEWLSGRRVPAGGVGLRLPGATTDGAAALAAIVSRGLQADPAARFPSCTAFVDALADRLGDAAPRPARSAVRRPVPSEAPRLLFDDGAADDADPMLQFGPALNADTTVPRLAGAHPADLTDLGRLQPAGADEAPADHVPANEVREAEADLAGGALMTLAIDDTPVDDHWDTPAPAATTSGPLSLDDQDDHDHDHGHDHDVDEIDEPGDALETLADEGAAPDDALRVDDRLDIAGGRSADDVAPVRRFDDAPLPPSRDEFAVDDDHTGQAPPPLAPASVATWAGLLVLLTLGALAGGWMLLRWGTPSAPQVATTAPVSPSAADPAPAPASPSPAQPETSSPAADTPAPPTRAEAGPPPSAPAPAPAAVSPAPSAAAPAANAPAATRATPPAAADGASRRPSAAAASPSVADRAGAQTRPPQAPASRPAPAAAGRLLVRTRPAGAEVFVNGERRGVTPLTLRSLALGTYTVRLVHGGYTPAEQRVVLNAGRPARSLDVALSRVRAATTPSPARPAAPAASSPAEPGSLLVDSRPGGARVFVDGRDVGVTPVTVPSLAAGSHTVRIERAGYAPISTTARVEARTRARVAVTLTALRP